MVYVAHKLEKNSEYIMLKICLSRQNPDKSTPWENTLDLNDVEKECASSVPGSHKKYNNDFFLDL